MQSDAVDIDEPQMVADFSLQSFCRTHLFVPLKGGDSDEESSCKLKIH